jgi:hypothetical protein
VSFVASVVDRVGIIRRDQQHVLQLLSCQFDDFFVGAGGHHLSQLHARAGMLWIQKRGFLESGKCLAGSA